MLTQKFEQKIFLSLDEEESLDDCAAAAAGLVPTVLFGGGFVATGCLDVGLEALVSYIEN